MAIPKQTHNPRANALNLVAERFILRAGKGCEFMKVGFRGNISGIFRFFLENQDREIGVRLTLLKSGLQGND
jgi:hypothetical protein